MAAVRIFSAYCETSFTVTASNASLHDEDMDRGPGTLRRLNLRLYQDPAHPTSTMPGFAPVTSARYRTTGLKSLRGLGVLNIEFGQFRQSAVTKRVRVQFRAEAFNVGNRPHFNNPGMNISHTSAA